MLRDFSLRDFGASLNAVESYTNESSQGKIGLCETVNKQKCTHLGIFLASETVTYKLAKKDYNNNPISNHDLLKFTFERRNKSRLVDGKWQKCLEEFEDWIKTYVIK